VPPPRRSSSVRFRRAGNKSFAIVKTRGNTTNVEHIQIEAEP
jgi:hypothetical protein